MKTCDVFTCHDEKASNHLQVEDSKQIKKNNKRSGENVYRTPSEWNEC